MRQVNIAILAFLTCCAASAQTTGTTPSFEVASVKPAAPIDRNALGGRGGRGSPGQVMFTNSPMTQLLMYAYGVKRYQISGPSWLDAERYDIVAKLPEGATRADSPPMLQTLLAQRFQLAVHRETKELPIYALVVAKNGPKMKETEALPAPKDGVDVPPPGPLAPPSERKMGADGFPIIPTGGRGGVMQMQMMPGHFRMKVTMETMAQMADMLSNQLDRPVLDQTGLTKNYEFLLDFAPEPGGGRNPMGAPLPMLPPSEGGAAADIDAAPSIFTALQEQLGLRLEQRKGSVELLVIDHIEKTPIEN